MATLTLRTLTRAGSVTKNAPLTHVELDANFVALDSASTNNVFDSGMVVSDGITVNNNGIDIIQGDLTLRDGDILYNPKLGFVDLVANAERARFDSAGSFLVGSTLNSQDVNYKFARVGEQHVLTGNKTSNSGQTTRQELGPAGDGTETGVGLLATQATTNFNDWTMDLFVSNAADGYINAISIDQFGETTFNKKVIFADSAEFQNGLNVTGGDILVNGSPIASGSVSSVGMTVPTGLTVTGAPITSAGTLALTYTGSHSAGLPSNTLQGQWNTAFSWGDHSTAGYLPTSHNVANNHIDHSAVSLAAGAGLTGGGDITASRSFDVGAGNGIAVNANDVAMSGSYTGTFAVTGEISATVNICLVSDERLKSNVETLEGNKVYDMRGVSFEMDGNSSSGVIAQELEAVAPELVIENEDGYKTVAYQNLVGYLIEAVKDLKSEIEELKAR